MEINGGPPVPKKLPPGEGRRRPHTTQALMSSRRRRQTRDNLSVSKRVTSAPIMDSYRNQVKERVLQAMKGQPSGRTTAPITNRDEDCSSPVMAAAGVWKTKLLEQRPQLHNRMKKMTISEAVGEQ